jgi:hypothetical protein
MTGVGGKLVVVLLPPVNIIDRKLWSHAKPRSIYGSRPNQNVKLCNYAYSQELWAFSILGIKISKFFFQSLVESRTKSERRCER